MWLAAQRILKVKVFNIFTGTYLNKSPEGIFRATNKKEYYKLPSDACFVSTDIRCVFCE